MVLYEINYNSLLFYYDIAGADAGQHAIAMTIYYRTQGSAAKGTQLTRIQLVSFL